jgi:hypothetical protein
MMQAMMFPAAFNGHDFGNVLLRWIHIVAGVIWRSKRPITASLL